MMTIYLINHSFEYACQHVAKVFSNQITSEVVTDSFVPPATQHIVSRVLFFAESIEVRTLLQSRDTIDYQVSTKLAKTVDKARLKRIVIKGLYDCLAHRYQRRPAWGILVGVRPTKLVHSMLDRDVSIADIAKYLTKQYYLSPSKIALLLEICQAERPLLNTLKDDHFSIYIGVPFCPSRCVYCSFTSAITKQGSAEIDRYVAALIEELIGVHDLYIDKYVDSVYIGGGTPAMLNSEQIDLIFKTIRNYYQVDKIREITFEAGRPKLIDDRLLTCLKRNGVTRICINPQTMHDTTLTKINRLHSVDDITNAFQLVKKYQFEAVNADVIAGLADEDISMFEQTITQLIDYRPDNITVHTLALKRGSKLAENAREHQFIGESIVKQQIALADELLRESGYLPYYMYRQKYMLGNLENVGYTLAGKASLYNIVIMEERQSIIAFGAGTTSKLVAKNNKITRLHNPKSVSLYIDNIAQLISKKRNLEFSENN